MKFVSKNNLDLKDTPISDLFITDYMPKLNNNAVKIYLYLIYANKQAVELEEKNIQDILMLTNVQMYDSLNELLKYNLLIKNENEYIIKDLKEVEIEKKYSPKIEPKKGKYATERDERRTEAILAINELYFDSNMPTVWFSDISLWFEKYMFDEDVMIALFNICKEKLYKGYIEKVADTWFKAGVKSYESLEEYWTWSEEIKKTERKLSRLLRLNRNLIDSEYKLVTTWVIDYRYNLPIIEYALSKTVGKLNPIQYMHTILTEWHKKKYNSLEDIKQNESVYQTKIDLFDKQEITKQNKKVSNKKEKFKDYEQRTYEDLDEYYS